MGSSTPSKHETRRVLGDLSPNSKVDSRTPTAADFRSTKSLFTGESNTPKFPRMGLLNTPTTSARSSPLRTAKKRTIDQVDGPIESPSHTLRRAGDRAEDELKSVQKAPLQATPMSPTVASTTSEDTTTEHEEELPRPKLTSQDSNATQASFSSLIDYNPLGLSSQRTEDAKDAVEITETISVAKTRAETLRLRLRVAMYKVQTNQIHVPMSRLELRSSPSLSQPSTPTTAVADGLASPLKHPIKTIERTPISRSITPVATREDTVKSFPLGSPVKVEKSTTQETRADASNTLNAQDPSLSNVPKLLPGPVLKPTAYSSRFITMESPAASHSDGALGNNDAVSSCSVERQTDGIEHIPSSLGRDTERSNEETSSQASTVVDVTTPIEATPGSDTEMANGEDTAANGLLELMRAGASRAASQ
ncbi:MAG: hypothetical protein M1820_006033 [Bogoriella megaspora]|nr:MAG: hypothetical protein M1820_006033 [Bogoriella megaspora]